MSSESVVDRRRTVTRIWLWASETKITFVFRPSALQGLCGGGEQKWFSQSVRIPVPDSSSYQGKEFVVLCQSRFELRCWWFWGPISTSMARWLLLGVCTTVWIRQSIPSKQSPERICCWQTTKVRNLHNNRAYTHTPDPHIHPSSVLCGSCQKRIPKRTQ